MKPQLAAVTAAGDPPPRRNENSIANGQQWCRQSRPSRCIKKVKHKGRLYGGFEKTEETMRHQTARFARLTIRLVRGLRFRDVITQRRARVVDVPVTQENGARCDPESQAKAFLQERTINFKKCRPKILEALIKSKKEMDPTRHSVQDQGVDTPMLEGILAVS